MPDRAVHRVVRAEREKDRDGGAEAECEGEPATARPDEDDEPGDRDEWGQPAEEDERLRSVARVPGDEVEPGRRVDLHLRERAAALVDRPLDHRVTDEDAREDRGDDPDRRLEERPVRARPADRVEEVEGNRRQREVHLAGEGDRDEGQAGKPPPALVVGSPRPLEGPQRERQQERDRAEQVAAALREAVWSDLEGEPACGCCERRERQFAKPEHCEHPGAEQAQQREEVPGDDRAEEGDERPEGQPERPPRRVVLRARLGAERVRVVPRHVAVPELVAREPEVVAGLEVVAGRGLAVPGRAARHELAREVRDRGLGRDHRGDRVERASRRLQSPGGGQQLVEVRHLLVLVAP